MWIRRVGLASPEYFRQQLTAESAEHPNEETRWYLGNLLERFSSNDALFSYEEGELCIRPLALLYDDARQHPHERERCLLLRQLGDQALFLGALFPEHYARKGIRRDYFIGMGTGAYDYLADHAREMREVFAELAESFARILELVARICRPLPSVRCRGDHGTLPALAAHRQSGTGAAAGGGGDHRGGYAGAMPLNCAVPTCAASGTTIVLPSAEPADRERRSI